MIAPRGRLLGVVALVLLPAAAAGATSARAALAMLALAAVLVIAVAVDAAFGRRRLAGLRVELPEVVRLFEQREGEFEVILHNSHGTAHRVRAGLVLPAELTALPEDQLLDLPAGSSRASVHWRIVASRRGHYELGATRLGILSPLGLWEARNTEKVHCEIRIYPNLMLERESVAPLLLRKGSLGVHRQRQLGKGREFEKLREYVPGDSYDDIHWKATARRGVPITKVYQVERTQEIYVILDASRLSAREVPGGSTILERFVTAALILGLAAEQQGDLFGLVAYSNKVQRFIRAKNGAAHYSACRDALYSLEAEAVTPDFEELCTFLRLRLRRRALLLFLSELDDPLLSEQFVQQIGLLSRHHLVLANMLQPSDARPLFTGDEPATVDQIYDHLGAHLQWRNLKELEAILRTHGVRFSLLNPERIGLELTTLYREVKQRQLI